MYSYHHQKEIRVKIFALNLALNPLVPDHVGCFSDYSQGRYSGLEDILSKDEVKIGEGASETIYE
jgi:hypothetical protein